MLSRRRFLKSAFGAGVVLAGLHHGLTQRLDPGAPLAGNTYRDGRATIPLTWPEALAAFERLGSLSAGRAAALGAGLVVLLPSASGR